MFDRVSTAQGRVGADLRTIDEQKLRLSELRRSSAKRISALEDTNMAEAISGMAQADAAYRAALGAASSVTKHVSHGLPAMTPAASARSRRGRNHRLGDSHLSRTASPASRPADSWVVLAAEDRDAAASAPRRGRRRRLVPGHRSAAVLEGYRCDLSDADRAALGADDDEPLLWLALVTIEPNGALTRQPARADRHQPATR